MYLPAEIIQRLNTLAERTRRSHGVYLRMALSAMLPQLEKGHGTNATAQFEDDVLEKAFRQINVELMDPSLQNQDPA